MDSGDWEQNSDEEREYRKAINNIRAKEMGFTEGEYDKFLNLIEKLEQALAKEPVYKWKSIYDTLEYANQPLKKMKISHEKTPQRAKAIQNLPLPETIISNIAHKGRLTPKTFLQILRDRISKINKMVEPQPEPASSSGESISSIGTVSGGIRTPPTSSSDTPPSTPRKKKDTSKTSGKKSRKKHPNKYPRKKPTSLRKKPKKKRRRRRKTGKRK